MWPWQEFTDHRADDRRAAEATAHQHAETNLAIAAVHRLQADVVHLDCSTILFGTRHRDLELARQEGEFRMEGRPLTDQLTPHQRINDLVRRDAGEMVAGGVADAIAAGLDRVHLHRRQMGEDFGNVFEFGPVVLDVLAGAEMAVAAVPFTGNVSECPQLAGRQQAIGNRHPQHGCKPLNIKAILQPQRAEVVLTQFTCEEAPGLAAKLGHPFVHQALIDLVIQIHVRHLAP